MDIAIVGVGLMGGAFGLALKELDSVGVVAGYDQSGEHLECALELGLIDRAVTFEECKNYDVIILATPVEGIKRSLALLDDISDSTTVIDLGSTKADIIEAIPKAIRRNVVPAHPMAGKEKFGPTAACSDLYRDKIVVICDIDESGELHRERALSIFAGIGMREFFMSAHEHDLHAAFISHMPHLLSYALANSVISQEDPTSILTLAAGGFRDMSRLAKSSPDMWIDIFKNNKKNLLYSLERCEDEISKAKQLLICEDWDGLKDWILSARQVHQVLPS